MTATRSIQSDWYGTVMINKLLTHTEVRFMQALSQVAEKESGVCPAATG